MSRISGRFLEKISSNIFLPNSNGGGGGVERKRSSVQKDYIVSGSSGVACMILNIL